METSTISVSPVPHLRHSHNTRHHHENLSNFINFTSLRSNSSFAQPSPLPHLQLPILNSTLVELEEISNVSNITDQDSSFKNFSSPQQDLSSLYMIIVPVLLFFCALTFLVNLIIVFSARWCRKPMSPTLYFSISLALADAYSSFILGTGLVVNSLMPAVYGKTWENQCLNLTLEVFRQGGVLVTVSHLLALAINHWIGIARPLHYAATMTRRTAWTVIISSWICPLLMEFIYFSSVRGQGFLSENCMDCSFLSKTTYRAFFASCFFAPLLLMSLIYLHIYLIVRNLHSHPLRYQVKNSCQQLRRNVKAAVTTVLILGTYIVGWMPNILFTVIVCDDCVIKLKEVPKEIRYPVGIVTNTLIILKALIDPIIYAARMSDIQLALRKMRYDILRFCCGSCVPALPPSDVNDRFSKFDRSLYETKSLRMSSGSSSSSRRTNAANAINTSLHRQHGNNGHSHVDNNSFRQHNSNNPSHCKLLENNKSAIEMIEINKQYSSKPNL